MLRAGLPTSVATHGGSRTAQDVTWPTRPASGDFQRCTTGRCLHQINATLAEVTNRRRFIVEKATEIRRRSEATLNRPGKSETPVLEDGSWASGR